MICSGHGTLPRVYCDILWTGKPACSTKFRDDGFRVDLGYFGHFRGTKVVERGSQLYRFLLELEDWVRAVHESSGAGRLGAEARGDWIRGKWKEVVQF